MVEILIWFLIDMKRDNFFIFILVEDLVVILCIWVILFFLCLLCKFYYFYFDVWLMNVLVICNGFLMFFLLFRLLMMKNIFLNEMLRSSRSLWKRLRLRSFLIFFDIIRRWVRIILKILLFVVLFLRRFLFFLIWI